MPGGFGRQLSGGGGGGGLHFRDPADVFSDTTLALARTARDTYFATVDGIAGLPEFQGDQSLVIKLEETTGNTQAFESYLPGQDGLAYDNTKWVDRTDAIQGDKGDMGDQGVWYARIFINVAVAPTAAPVGGSITEAGVITAPADWFTAVNIPALGAGEDTFESIALVNPTSDTFPLVPVWSYPFEVGGAGGAAAAAAAAASATAAATSETNAAASETAAGADASDAAADANRAEAAANTAVDIPTGSPRGALIGTSPTLSVTSVANSAVRAFGAAEVWALESNAPAGFVLPLIANNERFVFPDLHPPGMNGVFYVVKVGGTEIDEVVMPWGGVSQSPANANSVQYLSAVSSGAARNLTIRYFARSGDTPAYAAIYGAGTALPANTVVEV